MPYLSNSQRKFFHANKEELEDKGVNVSEWDQASKGKTLPEYVKAWLDQSTTKKTKFKL